MTFKKPEADFIIRNSSRLSFMVSYSYKNFWTIPILFCVSPVTMLFKKLLILDDLSFYVLHMKTKIAGLKSFWNAANISLTYIIASTILSSGKLK